MTDGFDVDGDQLPRIAAVLHATAVDTAWVASTLAAIDGHIADAGPLADSASAQVRQARTRLSTCAEDLRQLRDDVLRRSRLLADAEGGPAPQSFFDRLGSAAMDALNAFAERLPPMPDLQLDPNGPIMRRAHGETVNPLEWSEELARFQALFLLGFAPDDVRSAEATVDLPVAGAQTISATALVAGMLDASNLVGGPVEERLLDVLGKIAPRMERPFLAAVGRVLGREAPLTVGELSDALVELVARTGMSRRMAGQSLRHAIRSADAIDALGGSVDYGGIDAFGRPTGIRATITDGMAGGGGSSAPANDAIIPPGYSPQRPPLARGHLLGKQLGGSGDVFENLVALYQNDTNTPIMSDLERQVRRAVESGQRVEYEVTPIYDGADLRPARIRIRAQGTVVDGGGVGIAIDTVIDNAPAQRLVNPMPLLAAEGEVQP